MAIPPNPEPSGGGTAILFLLALAVILGGLLIWGFLHANPGRPSPTGTAKPATMPAGSGGPAAPAR